MASPLAAQGALYRVTRLPDVPGAFITVANNLNEAGQVVGYGQFTTSPVIRAFTWDSAAGITVLPVPPGYTNYAAVDVNNAGAVLGDAAGGGESWRYEDGLFTQLGTLNGYPVSSAGQLNESGHAAMTSDDFTIVTPPAGTLALRGSLVESTPAGYAFSLNESDQTVGYTTAISAYRFTPGVGALDLGALGTKTLTIGVDINAFGDVVGVASAANGNASVPFLYTDAGGMEEIGTFGGSAGAASINDSGEVIGGFTPSSDPQPWIWTRSAGILFLEDLYDVIGTNVGLISVTSINEAGVILGRGIDLSNGDGFPVLLSPLDSRAWSAPRNGHGVNPSVLRATTTPILGSTFDLDVDATAFPSATFGAVVAFESPLSGFSLFVGELLLDPNSGFIGSDTQTLAGSTSQHSFPVPNDVTLIGFQATFQGLLFGAGTTLLNGIDATLGN